MFYMDLSSGRLHRPVRSLDPRKTKLTQNENTCIHRRFMQIIHNFNTKQISIQNETTISIPVHRDSGCFLFAKELEKTQDAVIVYPQQAGKQQAQAIKITPVHDEIIKVSASATKTFSTNESLVALPQTQTVPFTVEENNDHLIISTAKTKVKVSTETGEIDFLDENGNPILEEKENGWKMVRAD